MSFEPQKFFIGVIDFFSVLLPGALLTFFLMDSVGPKLLGQKYYSIDGTQGGMIFLFSSYLLGHFVFMVGSCADVLDKVLRESTMLSQARDLAKGDKLKPFFLRWLAAILFGDKDCAMRRVLPLKKHYLDKVGAKDAVNAFQWSKARLVQCNPEGLATVQRHEANSKFFRSLMVVLLVLSLWWFVRSLWWSFNGCNSDVLTDSCDSYVLTLSCLVLILLSFWRYEMQRMKATSHTYWYILAQEASESKLDYKPDRKDKEDCTHEGGVVYRGRDTQREYLLVKAKNRPGKSGKWVLPKGHIETGEIASETAVREVREETGVWGRIDKDLDIIEMTYTDGGETFKVHFYLLERIEEGKPKEDRKILWVSIDTAIKELTYKESKDLLKRVGNIA